MPWSTFAMDCTPLTPKGGSDLTEERKGKINGEIDGLFSRLVSAGIDIDGSFVRIQNDVLKNYPDSSQLYIWERLIFLNCGILDGSSVSDTQKLTQLNSMVEKMSFGPPKKSKNPNENVRKMFTSTLNDIRESLYRKDEFMFPAMEDFLGDPTEGKWQEVVSVAKSNLGHIQQAIDESIDHDAAKANVSALSNYVKASGKKIKRHYKRTFKETRKQWNGRAVVLKQISVTKNMPSEAQAKEWLKKLKNYFTQIEIELEKIIYINSA